MLSFEGEQFLGVEGIMGKLQSLPSMQHAASSFDYQPTLSNGILAFVTGQLSIDNGPPMNYTQVFHLAVGGPSGYYVYNDIFRLNLAWTLPWRVKKILLNICNLKGSVNQIKV